MKVLFYSINTLMKIPNFASELDLMKQHLDAGDEIYVMHCREELQSCLVNLSHWKSKCHQCRTRFHRGMKALGLPPERLLHFESQVDYRILPKRFESQEALEAFAIEGVNLGEGIVSSIAAQLKDHKFDTHEHAALVRQKLEVSYLVYVSIQKHLKALKPDRVYLYNGRLAEAKPVLNSCLHARIPVFVVERAGTQGRYELYPNTIPLDIDYWTQDFRRLWEENPTGRREEIGAFYYEERRQAIDQGDRSFTKNQQQNLLPDGFDPAKKNVAIYLSTEYELAGYPERKHPVYPFQNECLERLAVDLADDPNIMLWVRCHPNITAVHNRQLLELQVMEARNWPNLKIIWPDSKVDTYALMDHADITFTFGSTVGIEATFWGKPSVLSGRAFYEHFDVSYIAHSHDELLHLLRADLQPKDKLGALIYGHGLMTNGYPFRYFQQTGLNEGNFLGETLELEENPLKAPRYYLLRKWDKLAAKLS
jgi:hypothetical protein